LAFLALLAFLASVNGVRETFGRREIRRGVRRIRGALKAGGVAKLGACTGRT